MKYVDLTIGPSSCTTYNPATRTCTGGSAQAWKTIQGALDAGLSPGDVLYIRSGTYAEAVIDSTSFGTASQPITIAGYPTDARPIIRPTGSEPNLLAWYVDFDISRAPRHLFMRFLDIDAINMPDNTGALRLNAPNVTLEDLIIRNSSRDTLGLFSRDLTVRQCQLLNAGRIQPGDQADTKGLGFYNAPDVPNDAGLGTPIGGNILIEDCLIEGCRGGGGVVHYGDGSNHNNIVIRRNIFRNFGDYSPWNSGGWPVGDYLKTATGVNVGGAGVNNGNVGPRNVQIDNNLFYNIKAPDGGWGHNFWGADDVRIFNNTYYNLDFAYYLLCFTTNTDFQLKNEIWSEITSETNFTEPDMGCGVTFTRTLSNNLLNPTVSATFVDAGSEDFHLISTASAVEGGADLSAYGVTPDLDGEPRPINEVYDCGCYEFFTGTGPAPGSAGAATFEVAVSFEAVGTRPTRGAASFDVAVDFDAFGEVVFASESENPKTYLFRTIDRKSGANGIEEFEFVREDLSIYPGSNQAPNLSGGSLGGSPAPPVIEDPNADNSRPGSTQIVFLDIPQLLSEHDGPGFHVAATGLSDGWVGALLFEKKGSEFVQIAEMGQRAAIGRADTKLNSGDVTLFDVSGRTYVYDDTNTVDVTLKDSVSTLVSVSDADLVAGVNAAAIGIHGRWEIILFGTATQLAEKKWRLSHLLRGMKGTEWAVGTHKAGDTFVLLDESIRRIRDSYTELDVARTFRAVSVGDSVDNTGNRTFTNSGVSLKPLSPVFLRGEEDADENRILRAYRRSRLDGLAGRDTYDPAPPLGETIERYEIDIRNSAGTVVLRTLIATSESVLYTAAQQVTDFGSVPASLNLCWHQMSETRGRGYAGCAVISSFDAIVPIDPGDQFYDICCYPHGKQRASRRILGVPIPRPLIFPAGLPLSRGKAFGAAATAETIYSLRKNGVEFATATFAAAGTVATFAAATDTLIDPAAGDGFEVIEPATPDATIADVGFVFVAERI